MVHMRDKNKHRPPATTRYAPGEEPPGVPTSPPRLGDRPPKGPPHEPSKSGHKRDPNTFPPEKVDPETLPVPDLPKRKSPANVSVRKEAAMPATSKAQQKAAGAALAAKRGEVPKSKLRGASKEMEKSMTKKQLEEFAHTKRKTLPERKT